VVREGPEPRVLDFDIETIAAGFADPNWVPQKITCVAWSWVGNDGVEIRTRLEDGIKPMLEDFLAAYNEADVVTGHNITRFDLPIVNSEMLRNGYPSLKTILAEDTMSLVKTKGFKKGQDVLATLLKLPVDKLPLNWQQWQDAYEEDDWATIKQRCAGDVIQHKLLRIEMKKRGMLNPPRKWKPRAS